MNESIILTGGGTAGHVLPSLALIPYLKPYFNEIHFIGSEKGMERDLVSANSNIIYHAIPCCKLHRSLSFANLTIPFVLLKGKHEASKLLAEIKPAVVFSKGGFVALPTMLSCKNTPLVLHESDNSIGLANKLALKKASCLLTSFPAIMSGHTKCIHVGSPLRSNIYLGDGRNTGIITTKPILLVTGGSQGSVAINTATWESLPILTSRFHVIHLTGKGKMNTGIISRNYTQLEYASNIQDYLALADIVVSRGGSGTLFELIALSKPSVIIPLPKSGSSRGDQEDNAKYFASKGYLVALPQAELNTESLIKAVYELYNSRQGFIERMRKAENIDGTRKIVEIILKVAKGKYK